MKTYFMTVIVLSVYLCPLLTLAQGLGQNSSAKDLEILIVRGDTQGAQGSLTSPSVKDAKEALKAIPGGIGFVETDDYGDQFIQSLGDTLVFTPGIYADTSAQRESRISIRGSGLNATFERRGIAVYRDNVPITRASGITEFQEIDPISIKYLEIYKGANAISLGTAALGGAINAVTPTGKNTDPGTSLRIESGSFDTTRFNINTTGEQGNIDYYASLTKLDSDGFRPHSEVDSLYGFTNMGYAISENIETRFYLTAISDNFELAGSVSQQDALENPETAVAVNFFPAFVAGGPGTFSAIDDDWDRNLDVTRLSNKTTFLIDNVKIEVGTWLSRRKLDHAITRFAGIIVQDEEEFGLSFRASNDNNKDTQTKWSLGLAANKSENDAQVWNNIFGQRSGLRSEDVQNAENATLYSQISIPVSDKTSLIAGGQYSYALREEESTGSLSFNNFSPAIGALWNINKHSQFYSNISQSYEPPGISDLTAGGAGDFDELDAQKAITLEFGSRGQAGIFAWDVSIYHSRVKDEFIDTESPVRPGTTITTNSVSDTIHQGVEAGLDLYPDFNMLSEKGITFSWRNSVTINDFSFDSHPTFGNNALAGVPDTIYISELRLDSIDAWYAGLNIRHIEDGPYLDFANTTQVDGYTLLGLTAGWNIGHAFRIFASAENITDKRYISNLSTVFQGDATDPQFTPGQGRAFYIGFSLDL